MPVQANHFQSAHRRATQRLLACAGMLALFIAPARAQMGGEQDFATPTLGGAVAGGAGLKGSADPATTDALPDQQFGFPGTNTANLGAKTPAKKVNLPPLRGSAIPERYPVQLPPLQAYPRSARVRSRGFEIELPVQALPSPTVAQIPAVPRKTIQPDENPFGPVGYEVGTTRVLPYVEQSFGYDSNPEQVSTGIKGSAFSRTEGGFAVQSDWAVHELKGTVRGGYDDFFNNPRANRPDAVGVMDLRLDATRDTKLDFEGRFNIDTQRPGSPELNVAVQDRPLITSLGATAGVTQAFGRFSVGLHGLFDRSAYEDGELTDGTRIDLGYQNFNDYGAKAKVAYELKPGLEPFVEIGYDRRVHDDTIDPSGYRRDSDGYGGRVGSTFEFWPQLTGTASVGYATRIYDDPRLKDLSGPTAAATLAWAMTPLTTLTLQGSTAFNETTVVGSSGIESRAASLTVSHALFRNLTLIGALGYEQDAYVGVPITEQTFTATLKAEYHLSRSLVLTASYAHQQLWSTQKSDEYTQEVGLVGLRLQH